MLLIINDHKVTCICYHGESLPLQVIYGILIAYVAISLYKEPLNVGEKRVRIWNVKVPPFTGGLFTRCRGIWAVEPLLELASDSLVRYCYPPSSVSLSSAPPYIALAGFCALLSRLSPHLGQSLLSTQIFHFGPNCARMLVICHIDEVVWNLHAEAIALFHAAHSNVCTHWGLNACCLLVPRNKVNRSDFLFKITKSKQSFQDYIRFS